MIRSFNTITEENIGYYCGLLTSVFSMAQFVSGKNRELSHESILILVKKKGMPMGSLSDRIGRKPVILFGLGQLSITIFLFGLAKSITWLLTVKLVSGLLVRSSIPKKTPPPILLLTLYRMVILVY
jgi:MFS family permease